MSARGAKGEFAAPWKTLISLIFPLAQLSPPAYNPRPMDGSRTIVGLALLGCLALGLRVWTVANAPPSPPAAAVAANESSSQGAGTTVAAADRVVQFLQCIAGTALVLAVAWLSWKLLPGQPGVGWLAALGAAVYPSHLRAVVSAQPALGAALAMTCLLAVAHSPRCRGSRRGALLAGFLAGALVLLQPALALALPICVFVFWWGDGARGFPEHFRRDALQRLAILALLATTIIGLGSAGSRLVAGHASEKGTVPFSASPLGATAENWDSPQATARPTLPGDVPSAGAARLCLERLRVFVHPGAATVEARLDRFAAIACMVLALVGASISCTHWRTLWPTYAVVATVALAQVLGLVRPSSCLPLEPIAFLWAALAVAPPLLRLFARPDIRVYRPGERLEDPLDQQQILRGPHYDVNVRRRAG